MGVRPAIAAGILSVAVIGVSSLAFATPEQLLEAARTGDRATVLSLLRENVPVDAAGNDGTTALHWATLQNDAELVAEMLAAGADPNVGNRYGITPLYLAAENGSAQIIELLLDAGADANEVGTEGETVLMTVARTGAVDGAELLLARGADIDARESWHGQTALMWAAGYGNPAMIETLVRHGADVNARSAIEEWERQRTAEPREKWLPPGGMTALSFAAREGCLECVHVLVDAGADVNQTTPDGISPVLTALINGHYDVAAALVEAGTDPNLYDETGRGALYAAIDFNTMPSSNRPAPDVLPNTHSALDVANMLIERGATIDASLNQGAPYRAKLDRGNDTALGAGTTPLMRAAKAGDLAAMRVLLEAGADPNLRTESGRRGRGGISPLLFAAGIGTAEQDTTGRFKTQQEAIDAIELLLEYGARIDDTDTQGRTALHGAALQGYNDVIVYLVGKGLALTAADNEGLTPLDTALGLAGGFGFSGNEGVVREDTAAVIRELMARTPSQ